MNKTILMMACILALAGCAHVEFSIDDAMFTQERMAHASTLGSIYLTSSTFYGSHNCDDDPSTCCASGYHMCTLSEALYGGRRMEMSGTGRETTPYNANGFVDSVSESSTYDCSGWTLAESGTGTRVYTSTASIVAGTIGCTGTYQVWCCSP